MTLVGLDTAVATGIGQDASDSEGAEVGRVRDPGDVNETIVDGGVGVHDGSTVGVFAVVDHHEGSVKVALVVELHIVDGQREGVGHESAGESL